MKTQSIFVYVLFMEFKFQFETIIITIRDCLKSHILN